MQLKPSTFEDLVLENQNDLDDNVFFYPAAESRSSRRIGKRSLISGRGAVPVPTSTKGKRQTIAFESLLEMKVLCILLADPVTMDVIEQPKAIRYTDPAGKNRSHTFDFIWVREDGTRIAIIVKPAAKAAAADFQDEVKAIRAAVRKSFADRVLLITDADFTRDQVLNAQRLLMFRPHIRPEHRARVDLVLPGLNYPLPLGEIIAALEIGSAGFGALLPALFDGRLATNPMAEFTSDTLVHRGVFS